MQPMAVKCLCQSFSSMLAWDAVEGGIEKGVWLVVDRNLATNSQ